MSYIFQDLRYGLRVLYRNPGFTIVAILTLALGIGMNTAIFSVIEAIMLRKLPVTNANQLVQPILQMPDSRITGFPYPHFQEFSHHNHTLSGICAFDYLNQANVLADGMPEVINGLLLTSDNYFTVLGVKALIGHTYSASNLHETGQDSVAVISYQYWKSRFGGESSILGKLIKVNGIPLTVIGVLPSDFFGVEIGKLPQVMIPISLQPKVTGYRSLLDDYLSYWVTIVGRLKSNVTWQQAEADLTILSHRSWAESVAVAPPAQRKDIEEFLPKLRLVIKPAATGTISELRDKYSYSLLLLMVVAGIVLLIASGNITSLVFERTLARQKEIAIRKAVGAGRMRLMGQLLTESLLLGVLGGIVSMFLAYWGSRTLVRMVFTGGHLIPIDTSPDFRIIGFGVTVSLVTGVIIGLGPSFHNASLDLASAMKENAGFSKRRGKHFAFGEALVITQIALTFLLLIAAGLLVRSLQKLSSVDLGFNQHGVLLFSLNAEQPGSQGQELGRFYELLREGIAALPGVWAASFSAQPPLSGSWAEEISVPDRTLRTWPDDVVFRRVVSPEYFKAMRIPLLFGRDFTPRDNVETPKVAILSASAARKYFGKENPLGVLVGLGSGTELDTKVVGIVGDTKDDGLRKGKPRLVYTPSLQGTFGPLGVTFEVQAAANPLGLVGAIRREVYTMDKTLPIYDVRTLSAQVSSSLAQEQLLVHLSGYLGSLALMLSCVGLYGVMVYTVSRRTHEIGIRMALGAQKSDVLKMVARRGLELVLAGLAIGIGSALVLTRLLTNFLYGVNPTDRITFVFVSLILTGVALTACYNPARRATKVDPSIALRHE